MSALQNIMVPVDGSAHAERAVDFTLELAAAGLARMVHLVNVQRPVSSTVTTFIGNKAVSGYLHDEGIKALASVRARLERANIPHHVHIGVGSPCDILAGFAKELGCDGIVMTAHGLGGGALLGSVARDVIAKTTLPVTLVK